MKQQKTIEERIAFLKSLELAAPDLGEINAPSAGAENAPACVDGSSLIAFSGGVSKRDQADVKNSCLLAQLAANRQFDREKQTREWYRFYATVLENVGWVVDQFTFKKLSSYGASFEASLLMLEILGAVCTGDEMQALKAALDAFRALAQNDYRVRIFETSSHSATIGNFQLSSCSVKDGWVAMTLGASYFSTTETITRLLFTKLSASSVDAYMGSQQVVLDTDVYSQVREEIIEKLGENAHDFIGDLVI